MSENRLSLNSYFPVLLLVEAGEPLQRGKLLLQCHPGWVATSGVIKLEKRHSGIDLRISGAHVDGHVDASIEAVWRLTRVDRPGREALALILGIVLVKELFLLL